MERLTFNIGSARDGGQLVVRRGATGAAIVTSPARLTRARQRAVTIVRDRFEWDYFWMIAFTALLFFRPQDHFRPIGALHLAELSAIAGLAAMAVRRLSAGETIAKINSEVIAIIALGGVIVMTIPFSFWPGGSLAMFSDIYVKIILIFALMISTLTSPRRLRQMTWVMIIASGYIAFRGVLDYSRGVNLVEGHRLGGAVSGMFGNPNDLALNLVTFLAPTLVIVLRERRTLPRLFASAIAVVMVAAIIFTKSRSGFLGLLAMSLVVVYYTLKLKPGVIFAMIVAAAVALPMMPDTFWNRMGSIGNAETDETGSRAARIQLMEQGVDVFLANPITGIGAGQFRNYDGPEMIEKWRVTHNVWLQVAAEIGIFGFMLFAYLVYRAFSSCAYTLRALRPARRKFAPGTPRPPAGGSPPTLLATDEERLILEMNARGMLAGLIGWFVCAFFASVAFNWTFYYVCALAVAGREITMVRRTAAAAKKDEAPAAGLLAVS
jgi:putative inorganic carbon (hco3(-)) transporter